MSDETKQPRDDGASWAKPVDHLQVSGVPAGGINLNVQGKQLTGLLKA